MISNYLKEKKINQTGSALVQILILSGLFAFILAAISNLMIINRNSIQRLQSQFNVNELNSQIYLHLLNGKACVATFTDASNPVNKDSTADQPILAIKNESGTDAFTPGLKYTNVTLEKMNVSKNNYETNLYTGTLNSSFEVKITYSYIASQNSSIETFRKFKIRTKTPIPWNDGNALVTPLETCVSFSTFAESGVYTNLVSKYAPDEKTNGVLTVGTLADPANLIVKGGLTMVAGLTLSDSSSKTNIQPMNVDLDQLLKINSYTYNLRGNEKIEYGFLSQEVAKVYPELVYRNPETNHLLLNYQGMIPVLFEANKKLEEENRNLESAISKLEERLNETSN